MMIYRILHVGAKIWILFSSGKQYFTNERSEWVKYCFCQEKIKFISSSRRVMFFLLYRQKDIDKIIEGNDRNYVIDKLTCEIMENKPLGSRMLFLWILRVVYFAVKHSCLYNKCKLDIQNCQIFRHYSALSKWKSWKTFRRNCLQVRQRRKEEAETKNSVNYKKMPKLQSWRK